MEEIFNQYLKLLWSLFQYDVDVFSQGWLYACLLVSAVAYFIFFILKWAVLTAPFWIPINMVFGGFKSLIKRSTPKKNNYVRR